MTKQSPATSLNTISTGQFPASANFVVRSLGRLLETSRRGFLRSLRVLSPMAAIVLFGVVAPAQITLLPSWNQLSPVTSPPARHIDAMAYDSAHSQVVLFGGYGSGQYNDTWLWNGTTWTQANPATVPPTRGGTTMAYDPVHGQVVMFGGLGNQFRLNDTWLWDGTNWTQASPVNSPPIRQNGSMVYDAVTGQILLFGGISTGSNYVNDTWAWNGTNWTQLSPFSSPPARAGAGIAYDASTSQVVLFGGSGNSGDLNDTWVWNGTNWIQQYPANSPSARDGAGMDYDLATSQVVLFGGQNGSASFNDTWLWNGSTWTQDSLAVSPSARSIETGMIYDTASAQMLLFGGYNNGDLGDTWSFAPSGNFGNVNVCPQGATTPAPCSSTLTLTYNVATTVTFAATEVLTQGAALLDFKLASSTCEGQVSAGSTCTVNLTFTPLAPGLRMGAVLLSNNTAQFVSTPVYGIGQGPAAAVAPGSPTVVATGFTNPNGAAVDALGNLYVTDFGAGTVQQIAPNGTSTPLGVTFTEPTGVAVDGLGDVFVADEGAGKIVEIPLSCLPSSCQSYLAVPAGITKESGVAVDGAGNVYFTSLSPAQLTEIPAGCTTASCAKVLWTGPAGPGTSQPDGVAVDAAGDIFIADGGGPHDVVKIPAGCASTACQTTVGTQFEAPTGVAVDAAGDVFVSDANLGVFEVPAGCASYSCQSYVLAGGAPFGVAIDGQSDVFVPLSTSQAVLEINRSQSEALNFPTTTLGTTSTASVTLQNVGNQALQPESPGLLSITGSSYSDTAGSGTPPDCSGTSSLTPGGQCNVSILFSPQSYTQPNTGTATFATNSLNAADAIQTVTLFGMGAKPVQSFYQVTVTEPGSGSGTVTDLSGAINCTEASGTSSGTCIASLPGSGTVTFTATPSGGSVFLGWGGACANSGTNSMCSLVLTAATTITANFGNPNFGNINVCPSGQATPVPCSSTLPVTFNFVATTTISSIKVVTQGATGLDFSLGTGSSCTGTVTAGNSCSVNVSFAPLASGLRVGAVELLDAGGNVLASTLISGVGQGPAAAIAPGVQSAVPFTGLSQYTVGLAVDAAGNTYVTDYGKALVAKVTPGGVQTTVPATGLISPVGVAVDGAGDVYIVDFGLSHVVMVTPSGVQSTLGSGLSLPIGIALDAAGDVFVGDRNNNRVVKITPGGVQTTVPATGLNQPWGVAVDTGGDVFIADGANSRVVEVTPSGVQTTVAATGLSQPYDIAVDAAGDLFIADPANTRVVEVPAGGGPQTTVGNGFDYPSGVTVDGAGDVFIGDQGQGQVFKVNRSQAPSLFFATTTVGSTSSDSPQSITLENVGNQALNAVGSGLIIVGADFAQVPGPGTPADCSASFALTPGQGCNISLSFTPQSAGNPNAGTLGIFDNSLNAIQTGEAVGLIGVGVASNFALNVATIGAGSGTVTDNLGEIACSGANGATLGLCSGPYASGTSVTLTASAVGTSLFTGWGGVCASAGTSPTCTVTITQAASVTASFVNSNLGNVNACPAGQNGPAPCSTTIPVTYNLATTTTLGAIKVVTQGASGLDFSLASGNTCVGTVTAGNSCTVNVTFAPLAPGLRRGAVQLYDNNANLVQSTPIYGVGQEPELVFGPATQTTVNTGTFTLSAPKGVLTDAAGNLFISDTIQQRVLKIAPNGTIATIGTGLQFPQEMAEDGAGNLFIADNNLNEIVEVPAGCTTSGCQQVLGANLRSQLGVAVDGAGNVFIGDFLDGEVVKSPAGCTTNACQTVVYSPGAGSSPNGITVDSAGNLYVADFGLKQVVEVPAGCASSACQINIGTGFWNQPDGVTVDAAGDVFVADAGLDEIVEAPTGCTAAACLGVVLSGIDTVAVAADAAGDLFVDDLVNSRVVELSRLQIPSLSFAQTNVGSTSNDSPKSISLQNIGNQPLTGSLALNLGGNFTQTASFDCSTAFPLAPGASCIDTFSFAPQSATFLSGSAVYTDNNLNGSSVAQTITLSGTGATNGVAGLATVPNVVGQVQSAATVPITGAGLAMGTVSTASSQTVPSGSIVSQSPAAGTQVAVGSAVNLLVSTGLPQPNAPDPLSLNNNYFLTGDYVSAGVTLRGTGVNGMATGTITIPNYTQSTTVGVPDGADIVDAFLYWETLENTPFASSTLGTFNGYSIVGQQIGNDLPNYVDGQFTGTIRSYRANVNLYLPVGAGGVRFASGAYTVSLPDSGGAALPLTEGASLVFVYRVLSPNFPLKSVVIYDGSAAPTAAGTQVVQGFYDAVGGASGMGKSTNIFASGGSWNSSANSVTLGQSSQYSATLNPASAYAAVILSTPVNNSDNDGILDAWKTGPTAAGDFHVGQPGYYDVKTATWVGLPGAKHGQKDLFVQLDYMCGNILASGSCDPTQENLFPSPDVNGNDPLAMVQQAFANSGVQLHLQIGNAVPETTCMDGNSSQLCQFPGQPGVVGWKNSLEFSKLYPRNVAACLSGGDCTTRFPYGQKDSYHYVLMGHSLAIPAWNTRYGTLTSISVVNGVTTVGTVDRGVGSINACPSRITISGVLGNASLNGVYNTTGCADTKTITFATPGVPNYTYPNNTLAEPVIGLTSGTISSISGYSDLGGADSAVTLGLWLTAPGQDMSKKANVVAGTIFHEIGHTLGLSHGGLYYDTPNSFVPTFEGNCKPNYQSVMNYLFQLDLVGPNNTLAFSNQTLNTLNENTAGSVTQLTEASTNNAATFPTSAWYVPYTTGSTATPATRHCDGTPLIGDSAYRVDAPIAPIIPPWSNGQDLNFIGTLQTQERGYNDLTNMDLRQVGATGGEFASLASVLSFGSSVAPLNIGANGNVTLGSGGTVALGSGGTVTLGSGGNVTLGSGGTVTLGSGGNVTLGSGGNVTLGSGGTVTPGSGGTVTLGSGGNVTLGSGGTITLGSGGNVTLGSGGNVTLGSGGTIALGSGVTVTIPSSGGSYAIPSGGGTITLGNGGNVTLGSGGNVTLGSGGVIALGSGGNVTLGSGGNVTLGSGGTIALGSGGNITLASGGNVTLGSGGTVALGSGGTVTLGSGGNVTLGSGGTVTLGSGGNVALGSGGNVTLGSGGNVTLGSGGTVTLGSGGNVTLGSGGNVTLGSGGTIALGSGGNVTLGSGGNVTLGSGGNVTLGSGGTVTLGSGGTVIFGSGGTVTLGSGGAPIPVSAGGNYTFLGGGGTVTLGSGGTVTLGSGGNVTLGSGGIITESGGGTVTLGSGGNVVLGSGGNITLGSGGNVTLGSGGTVTLGSGGNVTLGSGGVVTLGNGGSVNLGSGSDIALGSVSNITPASGGPAAANELTYETANSVVRPPTAPAETSTPAGVRVTWNAPLFGVVQTYTIYRSSDGATPIVIGSVSGVNGNPPATEFTDTNPDLTSATVVYTISTLLVPDTTGASSRQSVPSPPAVLKNDQSITLGPLPSSVLITNPPTVTATAMSGGVPNGLQVIFSATGACAIGNQSVATNVSSAAVALTGTGSCTVTASQPGSTAFNAANSVSGTFMVLPQGSSTTSQTINFPLLPNAQYGNSFSLSATSTSGIAVGFAASGPCTVAGVISGAGVCTITASVPGNSTYSAASLTQSFVIYPAVLKVTASSLTSLYGQAFPALTYMYSGFVKNDQPSVVSGAPVLSTTATSTSSPGSYPITVSTGSLATPNYSFLYVTGTLTVQQANQTALTLIASSPLAYGQSETLSVTGGTTGGAVTYNLVSGPCALSIAKLTANGGTGACVVTATMAGNSNYNSVTSIPASIVTLSLASQAITFTTNPPASAAYGSSFTVAATSGSGSAVAFTSSGACSNSGATYTMNAGSGACSVIANQAGNSNYAAAPQVTKTVNATLATPTVTFTGAPSSAAYHSTFTVASTTNASTTAVIGSSGACSNTGSSVTMSSGTGTCSLTATWAADSHYSGITATQSTAATLVPQAITFTTNPPVNAAYNSTFNVVATGGASGNAVTFMSAGACSNSGATYTINAGSGTCSVIANQAGNSNYAAAVQVTKTVAATLAAPMVTFTGAPASAAYNSKFTVATTTNASTTAMIASSGACSNIGTAVTMTSGTGTCALTATWAADSHYSGITATQSTAATLVPQTITFTTNPPASAAYTSTFTVAATGGASGNAVTFTSAGACSNSGATYTMTNSTGTCSVIASQAGNLNYAAATLTKTVTATGPLVSVSPSSINFGTVYYGSVTTQNITVTNTGTAPATINDPILSIVKGGNSNEFVAVNLCPKPLAAGKSCTITIAFVAGPYYTPQTATLQIMSNAPGSPQSVALSALVINPQASFNPTSLSFGTIKHASSSTMNVTLSNPGGTILTLTGISVTGANKTSFVQTNNCGSSLAAGASCTVAIKFTPAAAGTFSANLTVVDNAQSGTQSVPLSGKGN